MNSYFSNAELKDKAKEKLTGHFGFLIGCTLLSSFLTYIVSVLFTNVYTYSNMAEFALGEAISFLVSLFTSVLNVGLTLIYLKTACGAPCSFSDLFSGYRNRFNVSLGVSFFRNLLSLLPGLAYAVPPDYAQFVARADNCVNIIWHLQSPGGGSHGSAQKADINNKGLPLIRQSRFVFSFMPRLR